MDHEVAIQTHAVERYLLGEMPTSERDAFEEHYFTCAECGDGVRAASALIGELKRSLRERGAAPKSSSPGWLSWLRPQILAPTFAALLLAVVVGYQNTVVVPDLEAPRSMTSAVILDGPTRGDAPEIREGEPLHFLAPLDGAKSARLYVELEEGSGSKVRAGVVAAPGAHKPLDVYFPGELNAGRYQIVIREGPGGRELARNTFEVVNR